VLPHPQCYAHLPNGIAACTSELTDAEPARDGIAQILRIPGTAPRAAVNGAA
jgi:hypothetical protein